MQTSPAQPLHPIVALAAIARVKFLTLTIVCIALAASYAQQHAPVWRLDLLWIVIIALAAHISVNAFNEYFDFRSGLDQQTMKTDFSGGSGTLPAQPHFAGAALVLALVSLAVVIAGGLYLSLQHNLQLLWFGALGCSLVLLYTDYFNRWPWLCYFAPGLGFGVCMVAGSIWVLQGELDTGAWVVAVFSGILASNLLLLNQLPDCHADESVGRKHITIRYGLRFTQKLFIVSYGAAIALLLGAVFMAWLPTLALSTLLPMLLLLPLTKRLLMLSQPVASSGAWNPLLATQVVMIHLCLITLALSI